MFRNRQGSIAVVVTVVVLVLAAGGAAAGCLLPVTVPAPRPPAQPHAISPAILDTLRPMMRAVVTTGTAADGGFGGDSADLIANALLRNL
ncbi:MAG: hypothetical protein WB800_37150 [Streptosporangiaceae bacterium]|jgi:hypothetical protein